MRLGSLSAAIAFILVAGTTCSLANAHSSDPHDASPQTAPATAKPANAGTRSAARNSPTLTNTKVAPASAGSHTSSQTTKAAAKPPVKSQTPSDKHTKPADENHEDVKPDSVANSPHDDAPRSAAASPNTPTSEDSTLNAAATLSLLTEGNARWVSNKPQAPNTDAARREEVAAGQHPMVTILTCADSRIPVERVFDRGVGDVFVIRVAGNVAGGSETGTIEYGVEHLKTPLLVVMGHTKCGAVAAAATNAPVHGFVAKLVSNIQPAVERARRANPDADEKTLSALAVNENVWQSVFDLFKSSQPIRELAASGQLKVVGAIYDITTGKVEFLGEHPWQNELLTSLGSKLATPPSAIATHTPKAEANHVIQPQAAKPESKPASTANAEHDGNTTDSSGH